MYVLTTPTLRFAVDTTGSCCYAGSVEVVSSFYVELVSTYRLCVECVEAGALQLHTCCASQSSAVRLGLGCGVERSARGTVKFDIFNVNLTVKNVKRPGHLTVNPST